MNVEYITMIILFIGSTIWARKDSNSFNKIVDRFIVSINSLSENIRSINDIQEVLLDIQLEHNNRILLCEDRITKAGW